MLPVARTALRRIGDDTDVVTYVSRYTRRRFASAFGPQAALEHLPPGVDTDRFAPDPVGARGVAGPLRAGRAPRRGVRVPAGAAQGSGHADPGAAGDPAARRRRRAGHRRRRTVPGGAAPAGASTPGSPTTWCSPTACPVDELPAHHAMADVFAMPCRTRGAGLDVEGLGIVYLEASATGVPVVAGRLRRRAGDGAATARPGWSSTAATSAPIAAAVSDLLADPDAGGRGWAPRGGDWVRRQSWQWRTRRARLARRAAAVRARRQSFA